MIKAVGYDSQGGFERLGVKSSDLPCESLALGSSGRLARPFGQRPRKVSCPVTGISARRCAPDLGGLSSMANDQAADCHRSRPAVLLDGDGVGHSGSDGGTDRLLTTRDVQELDQLCWRGRQTGRIDCQRADLGVTGHKSGQRKVRVDATPPLSRPVEGCG
jgi:hypothetical protein